MPDAYGNLISQADFAGRVRVRLHSYLDSENLVLGLQLNGAYIHNLTNGPAPDATIFTCEQIDGGFVLSQQEAEFGGPLMLWWGPGALYTPEELLRSDTVTSSEPDQRIFTVDFVNGCWFALNNFDHSYVADVKQSVTTEGNDVIPFHWNGGDNQIWRAQIVS
jgi:hypothetical protein